MEYIVLVETIKNWEKNRDLAKKQGNTTRAKTYQVRINKAMIEKKRIEAATPNDVLENLENKIKELEKNNIEMGKENRELWAKIDLLNKKIDTILNPETYKIKEPEPIKETTICPNCKRTVENMTEHQNKCIKTKPITNEIIAILK